MPYEYNLKIFINYLDRNKIQYTTMYYDYPVILADGIKFLVANDYLFDDKEFISICRKEDIVIIIDSSKAKNFGKANSTESNGLKHKHKCLEPLIGVDIDLFDKPIFPVKNDRPLYFYQVKVDGKRSSYEAFFDEKIRWQMILNRIQYSGGFIDAKWVLSAQNITRTCKQPSWLAKSFAKRIIQFYCSSEVIFDPFAGWGTIADAAKELKRTYIGYDYNSDLVSWHVSRGRNIEYGDARKVTYDGECSVFICPPYSDPKGGKCFKNYNFDGFDDSAKGMAQCEWLKVVMRNVPNASEYVMVCKILDEGWDKYVVDTKSNRSHFGTNNEYIVVVSSEDRAKVLDLIYELH